MRMLAAALAGMARARAFPAAIRIDLLASGRPWILAGGLGVALLALALYARERRVVSRAMGRVLLALRLLLAGVLVLGLLKPVVVRTQAEAIPPRLIVLEDVSRSMDVAGEAWPEERLLRVAAALGELPAGIRPCGLDAAHLVLPRFAEELGELEARARDLRRASPHALVPRRRLRAIRDRLSDLQQRIDALARGVLPDAIERSRASLASILEDAKGRLERLGERQARLRPATLAIALGRAAQDLSLVARRARELADAIDRETARSFGSRLAPIFARIRKLSRGTLARRLLESERSPFRRTGDVEVEIHHFDRDVRAAGTEGDGDGNGDGERTEDRKGGADPDGTRTGRAAGREAGEPSAPRALASRGRTDIAGALEKAAEKAGAEGTTTVLLVSDGNANAGGDPVLVAERLGRQGIAVQAVPMGVRVPPRDAAIVGITTSPIVFADDRLAVEVKIKADGMAGEKVRVRVREGERVIEKRPIDVGASLFRQTISFALDPGTPGIRRLVAEIEPERPDRFPRNERRAFSVRVVNDRIRVLLADGAPRWEYRFLRNLFLREPEIEFAYALAEPLRGGALAQDRSSRGYPREENEVHGFDCIILGDVSPAFLGEEGIEHLYSFVHERAGTLILIAGRRHMPQAYFDTPLGRLIPVARRPRPRSPGPFAVLPSRIGAHWTMLRLSEDPTASPRIWARLLPQPWISPFRHVERRTAEVLACFHPAGVARRRGGGAALQEDRQRAAIVAQNFGLGQVLYVAFDGTWRWRYKIGDRLHHRFWGQVIRWATADRLPAGNAFVKLGTDKPRYEHGERVTVRARLKGEAGLPLLDAMVSAEIERVAGPGGEPVERGTEERTALRLKPSLEGSGFYDGQVGRLPPGRYRVTLRVPELAARAADVAYEFEIAEEPSIELAELGMDEKLLARIAEASGGRVFPPEALGEVVRAIATARRERWIRSELSLWDDWPLLILAAAIVTAEWLLRKRAGLV